MWGEFELAGGVALASEDSGHAAQTPGGRGAAEGGDSRVGEQLGLVIAALALLGGEERDGDDEEVAGGFGLEGEDGLGEHGAEQRGGGGHALVLEQVD